MAKAPKSEEDPLVAAAFNGAAKVEDVAHAIKQLSPEEAEYFLGKLEAAIRKRKLQITGYLVAMVVWAVCMFLALAYYGTHDGFVGWVFLAPFGIVGLVLYAFGKWADKVGSILPPMPAAVAERTAAKAAKAAKAANPGSPNRSAPARK